MRIFKAYTLKEQLNTLMIDNKYKYLAQLYNLQIYRCVAEGRKKTTFEILENLTIIWNFIRKFVLQSICYRMRLKNPIIIQTYSKYYLSKSQREKKNVFIKRWDTFLFGERELINNQPSICVVDLTRPDDHLINQ